MWSIAIFLNDSCILDVLYKRKTVEIECGLASYCLNDKSKPYEQMYHEFAAVILRMHYLPLLYIWLLKFDNS